MSETATGPAGYSHDEAVAAITSYYKLVARAHAISGSYGLDLLHPPAEGWPQLSGDDAARRLGKSAAAMALIRHLPYFEVPDVVHIVPGVASLSYMAPPNLAPRTPGAPSEPPAAGGEETTPGLARHLVFLGEPPDLMEFGSDLCVDTQAGTAVLGNFHDETHPELFCDEDGWDAVTALAGAGADEDQEGRYDGLFAEHGRPGAAWCWRVGSFFAACERNLRELRWVPGVEEEGQRGHLHSEGEGEGEGEDEDEDEDEGRFALGLGTRRRLMRAHGWPGDGWNPRAARREVRRLLDCSTDESDDTGSDAGGEGEEESGAKGQKLPLRPADGPAENPSS